MKTIKQWTQYIKVDGWGKPFKVVKVEDVLGLIDEIRKDENLDGVAEHLEELKKRIEG